MNRLVGSFLLLSITCLPLGCNKTTGPKGPPLAKVSGTVTLDGQPMAGGEVRFTAPGQPPKSLEVKDGSFSGEVYSGKNHIDVVWDVDGGPNPTDPKAEHLKVNKISPKFLGPSSPLSADIPESGRSDLKFEVQSARK